MSFTKVDILEPLYERLIQGPDNSNGIRQRGLIYGLSYGYGGLTNPIAITIINYENEESFKVAAETLPFGVSLLGIVEYESADDDQEVYSTLDILDYPILFKVADDQLLASTGLDFRTMIELNVMSPSIFWEKSICTFRIRGKFLISSLLEIPDLKDCFALAKARIINQAAFVIGKQQTATILPRNGHLVSDLSYLKRKPTVTDVVKAVKQDLDDLKLKNGTYYRPDISLVDVQVLNDLTKCNSFKKSPVLISDKTARCKTFEHYLEIDCLCIVPMTMPAQYLYRKFNAAICSQFENGFHDNIRQQLGNSISANKPVAYHFWPRFCQHFITIIFPQNIPEEKLVSKREALHRLYFISETKPIFRRTSSILNNPTLYLISPHTSLSGKFSETQIISGHYEYRHYMQDGFNDEGWGCAYRSLQTIISWFRLQGYTQTNVPTHREIQECLVSLGDKKSTFVGSKQWIGSTEVGYVLEALLGISCRILALSSGGELASRASDLESHFRNYGTPVMIGGGVLAHTIIGVSRNPDSEDDVQFLVVDPHYNGKEDLKTILNKGWIGWKDTKFWSKSDFYNLCLPLLPSTI